MIMIGFILYIFKLLSSNVLELNDRYCYLTKINSMLIHLSLLMSQINFQIPIKNILMLYLVIIIFLYLDLIFKVY